MLLEKAKELLETGGYTCVLTDGERVHTSVLRGVRPLVQLVESKLPTAGFSAADKVVGKATAYLYVLLGVRGLYAQVISRSALEVLQAAGITVRYDTLVGHIINRQGDGICPFEEAVLEARDPDTAYAAIREKMRQMNIPI